MSRFIKGIGSHDCGDLLSASWRNRKASGVIQPKSDGLWMGGWWCKPQSESENLRIKIDEVQGQKKMAVSAQAERKFNLPSHFCSLRAFNELDNTYPHLQDWFLLRLPIQMLISFRETLTDIPRNNVFPVIWAPISPVKLTHKINHQNSYQV